MTSRRRKITAPIAMLVTACTLGVVATAGTAPAVAGEGDACARWGTTAPERLTGGQARKAILCLLNSERTEHGLVALDRNKKLQKAAQRHNREMLGTGCFDHECPGEADLDDRLDAISYLVGGLLEWAFGENIAWGLKDQGTPRAIVAAWMESPGHRANILHGDYREVGVGFSAGTPDAGNAPGGLYTVDFGLRVR